MAANLTKATFHNLKEVDEALIQANRIAMRNTLEKLRKDLYDFIASDVYSSVNTRYDEESLGDLSTVKWSGRTYSLLDPRTVETYIYNAFGKGVGGGIRFNDQPYYERSNLKSFVHGNIYTGEVAFTSFLEIMNDPSKLHDNPYHFPTGRELKRRSFIDDFLRYANANFEEIYAEFLRVALGGKVKIGKGSQGTSTTNPKNLPEPRTAKPQGITEAQIRADYADVRSRV